MPPKKEDVDNLRKKKDCSVDSSGLTKMSPPVSVSVSFALALSLDAALLVYVVFLLSKLWWMRRTLSIRGQFLLSVALSCVGIAVAFSAQFPYWDSNEVVVVCEIARQSPFSSVRDRRIIIA